LWIEGTIASLNSPGLFVTIPKGTTYVVGQTKRKSSFSLMKKNTPVGARSQKTCPPASGSRLTRKVRKLNGSLH
jgi:hypothetical protein